MSKTIIVHNSDSGFFDQRNKIEAALKENGLDAQFLDLTKSISSDIKNLLNNGTNLFIAAGGDGTVNAVAGVLAGSKARLGIIPLGTYNHLAKDLGIPLDIQDAVKVISRGKSKLIDTGVVNDQIFLNNSSIGIYARIARSKKQTKIWILRWSLGIFKALWFIIRPPSYTLNIKMNDDQLTRQTPILFIGNNKYDLTSLGLFNRERLDGGRLCIYILKTRNPLRLVLISISILFGRVNNSYFEEFDADNLIINSRKKRLLVAFDGEVKKLDAPLAYRLDNKVLKVII